ncbi:MAG: 5-(carboxyamino)imidazole ribonucleotide mutase [Deltaproteobacteria bacterium]|nr:5-(carboxyamino)imidazole ribonucleotide mutase [Deltaproteobacteria bacterium]
MTQPKVSIVMGSDSDFAVMEEAGKALREFGIPCEYRILSAHRTPDQCNEYVKGVEGRGIKVLIAGAGYSAHLAGVLAAGTVLPVIGVPLEGSPLNGLDALLAMGQMPGGIPVATMTIGKAGAKNAGIFAAEILAVHDEKISEKLKAFRKSQEEKVLKKDKEIQSK